MARGHNTRGLTRVEVLVITLVGAFLLSLLPPASRRVRSDAAETTCRANLAAIGRAMLIYANDYEDEFPRAGGRNTTWGETHQWDASNRYQAFGLNADGSGGTATISSCFYLLVKFQELHPKQFVCPGDKGTTEFKLLDVAGARPGLQLIDAWDFGPQAYKHCSYAYHMPFGLYGLTITMDPRLAVVADRNPWMRSPAGEPKSIAGFKPDLPAFKGTPEQARHGNSISHQEDGQNVLFLDTHVAFEERSYCGLDNDNIYLISLFPDGGSPLGVVPFPGSAPGNRKDSVLVHDPARLMTTPEASEVDSKSLKQTVVVATVDCPLPEHKSVIWCSTFQMAWDKLKRDIIAEPVQVLGAEALAGRLNQAEFAAGALEDKSYYAAAGFVKNGIVEEIQTQMIRRFPAEPVPTFDSRYRTLPEVILAYAYLNVDVGFEYPYYANEGEFSFLDSNGARTGVIAFCAQTDGSIIGNPPVRAQVEVLYYKDAPTPDLVEFAVDLSKGTQPYQVVLARIPRSNTLGQTVRTLQDKLAVFKNEPDYEILRKLRSIDTLIVPDVLYKLTHHFDELLGKSLGNPKWQDHFFFEAMQRIDFSLSRTGVILKSEARTGVAAGIRLSLDEPRHLHFDRPFLICVRKREPNATPFFLMWVGNAELMKRYESE